MQLVVAALSLLVLAQPDHLRADPAPRHALRIRPEARLDERIVRVTLTSTGPASVQANSASTAPFQVENIGTTAVGVNFSVTGCTGALSSCTPPGSLTLQPGDVVNVAVTIYGASAGSATITLKALNASGGATLASASVTATVTAPPPQVSVSGGGTVQGTAGSSGSADFTITNTGSVSAPVTLTPSCSGSAFNGGCTVSPTSTTLAVGASQVVTMGFNIVATGGTGTLTLTATNTSTGGTYGSASRGVTAAPAPPQVSIETNGTTNSGAGAQGTSSFLVRNTGIVDAPLSFSASCSGAGVLTSPCYLTGTVPTSLAPYAYAYVNVIFQSANAGGTGYVTLVATNSSTGGQYATLTNTTTSAPPPPQVAASANAGSIQGTAGQAGSAAFTITNTGYVPAPVTLTPTCSGGGLTSTCTVSPSSTTLAVGASATITVGFSFVQAGGSGTVTLAATNSGTGGSYGTPPTTSVSAPPPPPQVAASANASTVQGTAGQAGSAAFTITNTGYVSAPVTLTPTCSGGGLTSTCTVSPSSTTLAVGASATVTVGFSFVPAGGSGTVTLAATNSGTGGSYGASPSTTVSAPAPPPQIVITPASGTLTLVANQTGTTPFTVQNTGYVTANLAFTASCAAPGLAASPCSPSPASLSLASGASTTVNVSVMGSAFGGPGSVTLTAGATGGAGPWSATRQASVSGGVSATLDVKTFHGGTTIERGLCPTLGIVPDVASQCGALRITHSMPAATVYGKQYAPTLAYYSDQVLGPTLQSIVTVGASSPIPDSVRINVYGVDPVTGNRTGLLRTGSYGGAPWAANRTQRVSSGVVWTLGGGSGTNIYTFDVELSLLTAAGWATSGPVVRGQVADVERLNASGPFGNGWWMLGLEELYPQVDGSVLWVDGDGSTRRYVSVGTANDTAIYVAPKVDRPDTLYRNINTGWWRRVLPARGSVFFDSLGRHRETRNRFNRSTIFAYRDIAGTRGRLTSITLPGGQLSYTLQYGTNVVTITAPGGRVMKVNLSSNAVTGIVDPDNVGVSLGYYPDPWGSTIAINSYTDRRQVRTDFAWDPWASTFGSATTPNAPAASVVQTIQSPRGRAVGVANEAPVAATEPDYVFDGPRTDVADLTKIWVDTLGAPTKIKNAIGDSTTIEHGDTQFPGLSTRVVHPNGFVQTSQYDARGHVSSTTSLNPNGDGQNATAQYAWHQKWDQLTSAVQPTGETSSFGIEESSGNVLWSQVGTDASRRAYFWYNADGQVDSLRAPLAPAAERYQRDTRGNLRTSWTPLGFATQYFKDTLGRDTLIVTPTDAAQTASRLTSQRITYDAMDRVVSTRTIGAAQPYNSDTPAGPLTLPPGSSAALTLAVDNHYDAEGHLTSVSRWSIPDPAYHGTVTTSWTYDSLGRRLTQTDVRGRTESWAYDPAGNAVQWTSRRGNVATMQYDALNRLTRKITPGVSYPQEICSYCTLALEQTVIDPTPAKRFPYFATHLDNGQFDPGVVIPGDTATFGYDVSGAMTSADNRDAKVRRSYYPGGMLKTDTLRIGVYDRADVPDPDPYQRHVYGLTYTYDLAGRLLTRRDSVGSCTDCIQRQHYAAITGLPDSTIDRGAVVTFGYDVAGRLTQLAVPSASVTETREYDGDSRLSHRIRSGGGIGTVYDDQMYYDARGKIVGLSVGSNLSTLIEQSAMSYDGLGGLAAAQRQRSTGLSTDEYKTDAMGDVVSNVRNRDQDDAGAQSGGAREYATDQLTVVGSSPFPSGRADASGYPAARQVDTTFRAFDYSGNETVANTHVWAWAEPLNTYYDSLGIWHVSAGGNSWARSYYGADEKLRVYQRTGYEAPPGVQPQAQLRTTFAEYKYDALGRRILTRTRRDSTCSGMYPYCDAPMDRMVWDGDQLLYENRVDGSYNRTGTLLEYEGSSSRVRYTHATGVPGLGGVDQPAITWVDGQGIVPHLSWRGNYEAGTYLTGGSAEDIVWPARYRDLYYAPDSKTTSSNPTPNRWIGSLMDGRADPTGLVYSRNRYYDPKAGRFTQEDPIGIAGGLNVYGFANGDPVSYSDPFGLCPVPATDCPPGYWTAMGTAMGALLGGTGGGTGGFVLGAGVGAIPGAAGGALKGALWGGLAGAYVDGLVFASKQSDAVGRAESLVDHIEGHLGKLGDDPEGPSSNGWRKEIRAGIDNVSRQLKDMKGKTQEQWAKTVKEWTQRLNDLNPD